MTEAEQMIREYNSKYRPVKEYAYNKHNTYNYKHCIGIIALLISIILFLKEVLHER